MIKSLLSALSVVEKIGIGLIGLGIVVFVHELGHFIAARLSGIDVEAFSIGWGKPLFKKKVGTVEYRLGIFPLGGYCKMSGDSDYQTVWESHKNGNELAAGSFFASHPWKRIFTCFAGPLFNFIFAIFALAVIWGRGTEMETLENRIVLLSDIDGGSYPSDQSGLKTGDRIITIKQKDIKHYFDLQKGISLNGDKSLSITVDRNGEKHDIYIRPKLDKSGAGKIGVYPWVTPEVVSIRPESPAAIAGLQPGDLLVALNREGVSAEEIPHVYAFLRIFKDSQPQDFSLDYKRNGVIETALFLNVNSIPSSGLPDLGIEYPVLHYSTPPLSPPAAIVTGGKEAAKILGVFVKGLSLLSKKEVDLSQAVSGPARITYMVGEVAAGGFEKSAADGFISALNFIALISISLCLMNLLPLPILDGGMIILYLTEMIMRKPIHPKVVSVFQTAGFVIIGGLMFFAFFNDILFFTSQ
jgi:regulator of sigma E protease